MVEVLDPLPGERILDLCAGPGIKTGQIAARVGRMGNMVSVEPIEERAEDVARQLERLGFHHGLVVEADARESEILSGFDRVLVDAPCSDLGALSSRPDARWRKSPALIERVAKLQGEILDRAAGFIREGGSLVYSTCTISKRRTAIQALELGRTTRPHDRRSRCPSPHLADPHDPRFLQLMPDRDQHHRLLHRPLPRADSVPGLGDAAIRDLTARTDSGMSTDRYGIIAPWRPSQRRRQSTAARPARAAESRG